MRGAVLLLALLAAAVTAAAVVEGDNRVPFLRDVGPGSDPVRTFRDGPPQPPSPSSLRDPPPFKSQYLPSSLNYTVPTGFHVAAMVYHDHDHLVIALICPGNFSETGPHIFCITIAPPSPFAAVMGFDALTGSMIWSTGFTIPVTLNASGTVESAGLYLAYSEKNAYVLTMHAVRTISFKHRTVSVAPVAEPNLLNIVNGVNLLPSGNVLVFSPMDALSLDSATGEYTTLFAVGGAAIRPPIVTDKGFAVGIGNGAQVYCFATGLNSPVYPSAFNGFTAVLGYDSTVVIATQMMNGLQSFDVCAQTSGWSITWNSTNSSINNIAAYYPNPNSASPVISVVLNWGTARIDGGTGKLHSELVLLPATVPPMPGVLGGYMAAGHTWIAVRTGSGAPMLGAAQVWRIGMRENAVLGTATLQFNDTAFAFTTPEYLIGTDTSAFIIFSIVPEMNERYAFLRFNPQGLTADGVGLLNPADCAASELEAPSVLASLNARTSTLYYSCGQALLQYQNM